MIVLRVLKVQQVVVKALTRQVVGVPAIQEVGGDILRCRAVDTNVAVHPAFLSECNVTLITDRSGVVVDGIPPIIGEINATDISHRLSAFVLGAVHCNHHVLLVVRG